MGRKNERQTAVCLCLYTKETRMRTIFLDIETADWFDSPRLVHLPRDEQVHHLPFGLAVTITSTRISQRWDNAKTLLNYLDGARIVTWNGDAFDIPIIERIAGRFGYGIQSLDLFSVIRTETNRWYSLEQVAIVNGMGKKTGSGMQAAKWIASGEQELIEQAYAYCEADVRLLLRIAERMHTTGIRLPARPKRDETADLNIRFNGQGWEVREC